jgi:hypothetical protein
MFAPENILKQMKCGLSNDGHVVANEPILLKCGANARKSCVLNQIEIFECFSCNENHERKDYLNSTIDKMVEHVFDLFLKDLFQDLNKNLETMVSLLKGKLMRIF